MPSVSYVCPETRQPLTVTEDGLLRSDGKLYRFLPTDVAGATRAPDFTAAVEAGEGAQASLSMYDSRVAVEVYRNFLDWLFATFRQDEAAFRASMAARLRLAPGARVLVTGAGLGDDISAILEQVGSTGEVHAQDLSPAMVAKAASTWAATGAAVHFSAGDALRLPFADGAFDAAFHFGGINLFDDVGQGLAEMARVVRVGGRVVAGDEGVAPWLRDTDYGRMVIANNRLWAYAAPIERLPPNAQDVNLTWVLGECFWVIEFTVGRGLPEIDPNVAHKGWRGGSMWTRHHGQLEAVTPQTKARVLEAAAAQGLSVHDWLEQALGRELGAKARQP